MNAIFLALAFTFCFISRLVSADVDPSKVVIVLSHGRSGSTELCYIVENIIGAPAHKEFFGSTSQSMKKRENPLEDMLAFLGELQADNPGKTVGFKWKPYSHQEQYDKVWKWVARNRVKVVYNYRNPLDVLISGVRLHEEDGISNCRANDEECAKTQKALTVDVNVTNIVSELDKLKVGGIEIIVHLSKQQVNYYDVTYEGINRGEMADRLAYVQAMADFIQPGFKVTEKVFETHTQFIGHYHQVEEVKNYAELQAALQGTRFSQCLH
jgi:hypothetical protein